MCQAKLLVIGILVSGIKYQVSGIRYQDLLISDFGGTISDLPTVTLAFKSEIKNPKSEILKSASPT